MDYLFLLLLASFVWISIQILISKLDIKTPKSLKLPPGPKPLPIIGNILEFGNQPHQALAKLSKTYGPIMTMKLGNITTIVISSPQLAKEVLHKNDLISTYRTVPDTLRALDHHIYSVGWMQHSPIWKTLRKVCATKVFSPQQLNCTQVVRQKKLKELSNFLEEHSEKGEILNISEVIFITVLNFLSNTLFSIDLVSFGGSNKSQEFMDIICGISEEALKPNVVDFFPFLRRIDPQGARARMTKYFRKIMDIFDGFVEERLRLRPQEMDTKEYNKDVLDYLLEVMEDDSQVSRIHVLHLLLDLFVAGLDTTSVSIEWASNPEKLQKMKEELEHVLGKDNNDDEQQLEESHISNLPFLTAVFKETFRLHTPLPFLLPHKSQEDVELYGFTVPKNAQVLVNVWAMGRDSSIWTNPNEFMPERFLGSKIDFKGQDFELIPFGAGRRICPGLPLAYRAMHIVLGTLVHGYDWKLVNGQKAKDLDMSSIFGLTLHKAQPLQAIPIKT